MNIGIVTTWFERGAAYVSKQFEDILSGENNVFIYARGGEKSAVGNPNWDKKNVTWGTRISSPFAKTVIDKTDFIKWINNNSIKLIIFNEQQWWPPLLWCRELGVKTVAYIDYYTEETVPLFEIYDGVICNTKRHYSVFKDMQNAYYLPWGTNVDLFNNVNDELINNNLVTYFHSAGMHPHRKGTDILVEAFYDTKEEAQLIIHTQKSLKTAFPHLEKKIEELSKQKKIKIIEETVSAPGLYHLGDLYIYPSRIEGIGLTIAEAISSGLGCVVTNNGPMNEFIKDSHGSLIEVDKYYSRSDGYYWPISEASITNLTEIIDYYSVRKDLVIQMKKNARKYALESLDWSKNSFNLLNIVEEIQKNPVCRCKEKVKEKINHYENSGSRGLNRYHLKFYFLSNFFRELCLKIKYR